MVSRNELSILATTFIMKRTSLYICCFIFIILVSGARSNSEERGRVYRSRSRRGGVNRLNKVVQTPGQGTEAASREYSPPSPPPR
ncbi:hypothetical protein K2173_017130 [Erythroxylum novogranatense]|uniref:Secreted protein n=1 Tax=Erythroxylum novogranatense TaxID=1862640 RepID=A0AAV8U922_9ROSI|nr:hypothetical protein K2173_017130 [Erythroxylum novogranatense]